MSDETNSNLGSRQSRTAFQDSTKESIESNSGPVARADAKVEDRAGLYVAIVALVIAAISLGISLMQPAVTNAKVENLQDRVQTAERESRVMQERWNDLKVELAKKGIAVSDH